MAHIYELHRFVLEEFPWLEGKLVLDIGCGKGDWAYMLRSEKRGDRGRIIGLDISQDYLGFIKKYSPYDAVFECDLNKGLPFVDKSVDIILASEIIEHLEKDKAMFLLREMERVAKEKIILTCPNGPWELGLEQKNTYEVHRSAFYVGEFKKMGYRTHGVGFRFFKLWVAKQMGLQKLWAFFCYLFTPISYLFPVLGEYIVACKKPGDGAAGRRR